MKSATKASTGCGGCAALLKSVVEHELESRGVSVDRSLCEHFPFTRQQIFHLCKVEQLRTFDELLANHGKGRGCDICKPAVASILASLWNEHVLARPHAALQDTNDHFLANMQKDGTYSVVPRIPGGEITPDKLIVIGEVAQELRALHQDHRRPAHRPVRRPRRAAAGDLEASWSTPASSPATPTASRCAR